MKNLRKLVISTLLALLFVSCAFAQQKADKTIPEIVVSSLNKKYPGANLKRWKVRGEVYMAKIIFNHHTYFAAFDNTGKWISTMSKIRWTWNLPKNVNKAYKKSEYRSWNVYFVKRLEKPTGIYYQLMVDNANFNEIAFSEGKFETDRLIEFNSDGLLTMDKNITDNPVP